GEAVLAVGRGGAGGRGRHRIDLPFAGDRLRHVVGGTRLRQLGEQPQRGLRPGGGNAQRRIVGSGRGRRGGDAGGGALAGFGDACRVGPQARGLEDHGRLQLDAEALADAVGEAYGGERKG